MTLEELRLECGWSINEMARECKLSFQTASKALKGGAVTLGTAKKIATAMSRELGRPIRWSEISGLNVKG